jgi:hypothetical protein
VPRESTSGAVGGCNITNTKKLIFQNVYFHTYNALPWPNMQTMGPPVFLELPTTPTWANFAAVPRPAQKRKNDDDKKVTKKSKSISSRVVNSCAISRDKKSARGIGWGKNTAMREQPCIAVDAIYFWEKTYFKWLALLPNPHLQYSPA